MHKAKENKHKKFERYLEIAAEAGSLVMKLRDKPTRLDWLSLGLQGVSLAVRVRSTLRNEQAKSAWSFFDDDGCDADWIAIPDALSKLVMRHVRDPELQEEYWDEGLHSDRVVVGSLDGEEVGWICDSEGELSDGPYMRSKRRAETHAALGRCLWRELGEDSLVFGEDGLSSDPFVGGRSLPTTQFTELRTRVSAFLDKGIGRSLLFHGPPGTGKSTGIRNLARELGLCTLRVDIKLLTRWHRGADLAQSVDTLVRALRPDALVLDDIDRVQNEEELLHLFELANRTCKLTLASTNSLSRLSSAVLRPGRFDEIVEVNRPDSKVVRMLLGNDRDLVKQIGHLPMAYVTEFVKRRDVLGRDAALRELAPLLERFEKTKECE